MTSLLHQSRVSSSMTGAAARDRVELPLWMHFACFLKFMSMALLVVQRYPR